MRPASILVGVMLFVDALCAAGYELATHARITYSAFLHSTLNVDASVLANLGLAKGENEQFGGYYFDVLNSYFRLRMQQDFDWDQGKMPDGDNLEARELGLRLPGWLMRGAVREDDSAKPTADYNTAIFSAEQEPLDDPYGDFNRWCNHFFDPYHNRALELPWTLKPACAGDIYGSAPVWAIGVAGPFSNPLPDVENANRRNHFTILDAREAMWRALTGYDKGRTLKVAKDKPTRDAYWATAFRALGDVLHLNQDMAQPQHTRNEAHGLGHAAWYEKYVDGRAKGVRNIVYNYLIGELRASDAEPLAFSGHSYIPQFNNYESFWSTGTGAATMSGNGLADYSSRGFFTLAKNLGNSEYPSPSPDPNAYDRRTVTSSKGWKETYLFGSIPDSYDGTASSPFRMTRQSVWDDSLQSREIANPGPVYTLDRATYDDRAALLLPRAVAYSAGILNYFFRGKMEISLPDAGFFALRDDSDEAQPLPSGMRNSLGFWTIKLKLRNATAPIPSPDGTSYPQPMPRGMLVAVVKYRLNKCYTGENWPMSADAAKSCLAPDEEIVVSQPIEVAESGPVPIGSPEQPNGNEYTFNFADDPIPSNAWNITLQAVYRGRLGDERDAVVVATKDISEPTYVTFMNTTDHFTVDGKFYTPETLAADQSLFSRVRPTCVDRSTGTLRIYPECYNRPDRFIVTSGTDPVTISAAGYAAVLPRRMIRFVFLADLQTPVQLNWAPGDIRCALPENPLVVPAYRAQYDANDQWTYFIPGSLRGVHVWRAYYCYEDLGIEPTSSVEAIVGQLDSLTDEEQGPMPVTITGW